MAGIAFRRPRGKRGRENGGGPHQGPFLFGSVGRMGARATGVMAAGGVQLGRSLRGRSGGRGGRREVGEDAARPEGARAVLGRANGRRRAARRSSGWPTGVGKEDGVAGEALHQTRKQVREWGEELAARPMGRKGRPGARRIGRGSSPEFELGEKLTTVGNVAES